MPDTLPESELNISTGLRQNFSLNSLDISGCSLGVFLRENKVVNIELFTVYDPYKVISIPVATTQCKAIPTGRIICK